MTTIADRIDGKIGDRYVYTPAKLIFLFGVGYNCIVHQLIAPWYSTCQLAFRVYVAYWYIASKGSRAIDFNYNSVLLAISVSEPCPVTESILN